MISFSCCLYSYLSSDIKPKRARVTVLPTALSRSPQSLVGVRLSIHTAGPSCPAPPRRAPLRASHTLPATCEAVAAADRPNRIESMAGKGVECNSTNPRLKRCRRRRGFTGSINEVLPDDILVQILRCLPCQSAVRCKLVCKRWLSLISTPSFISCSVSHRRQIKHGQQQYDVKYPILKAHGMYLFLTSQTLNSDISFSFLPIPSSRLKYEIRIAASSDDLFLCTRWSDLAMSCPYFICNPFTKEWFQLPRHPDPLTRSLRPHHVYGFTHKPYYHCAEDGSVLVNSSCRFRVVLLQITVDTTRCRIREASEFEVDVFSSETWKWTTCMMQHSARPNTPDSCISRNGLLYWLCSLGQVIIYDPFNNKVRHVVDPFGQADRPYTYGFSVSQGSLLAFDKCFSRTGLSFWELEDEDCDGHQQPKWRFVTTSVDLKSDQMKAIAIHPNDKNIIYFQTVSGGIVTLSLRTGKVKRRPVQELVTIGNYGYEVRRLKVPANEMLLFNVPADEMVVFKALDTLGIQIGGLIREYLIRWSTFGMQVVTLQAWLIVKIFLCQKNLSRRIQKKSMSGNGARGKQTKLIRSGIL